MPLTSFRCANSASTAGYPDDNPVEAKGNPGLNTLELIAQGLNSELLLILKEKLSAVVALLEHNPSLQQSAKSTTENAQKSLADVPWQDLLGDNQ